MISRFEELTAWQMARELAKQVHHATKNAAWSRDYRLRSQITAAAVSIGSNIAEGFDRAARGEFHYFLTVAKGSCAEVRSQLYSAFDFGYIDEPTFRSILALSEDLSRVIGALRKSVEAGKKNRSRSTAKNVQRTTMTSVPSPQSTV